VSIGVGWVVDYWGAHGEVVVVRVDSLSPEGWKVLDLLNDEKSDSGMTFDELFDAIHIANSSTLKWNHCSGVVHCHRCGTEFVARWHRAHCGKKMCRPPSPVRTRRSRE